MVLSVLVGLVTNQARKPVSITNTRNNLDSAANLGNIIGLFLIKMPSLLNN